MEEKFKIKRECECVVCVCVCVISRLRPAGILKMRLFACLVVLLFDCSVVLLSVSQYVKLGGRTHENVNFEKKTSLFVLQKSPIYFLFFFFI